MKRAFERILSRSPEREIFEGLEKHLRLCIKAIDIAYAMLTRCCSDGGEAASKANEILILEREADSLAEDLFVKILKSPIPPALVPELQYLVDKTDDIMDRVYFIGMELSRAHRYGLASREGVRSFYSNIGVMMSLARSGIEKLLNLFQAALRDREAVIRLRSEIDIVEDRIDEAKSQALDKIYEGRILSPAEFFHLVELIRVVDDVADATEDVAHAVVRIESSVES